MFGQLIGNVVDKSSAENAEIILRIPIICDKIAAAARISGHDRSGFFIESSLGGARLATVFERRFFYENFLSHFRALGFVALFFSGVRNARNL
ncbi:hypothetical protein LEP1GSC047_1144 [Leptospira inadai serovar Lyme str. 10]|uniref:Uncharacterized protein n=1 Tax=Leptospira inadai serovar Lyme str. 10 TaxID=1049790 RepID=V6H7R5_9LEPT|nr:hypothetical protein LEP1GSC047_1144 [Leptospira inadai serovar Lyme str. 10]